MNSNVTHIQERIDTLWRGFLAMMIALGAAMLPLEALAGGNQNAISNLFCNVVEWFTGPIGKGLATLAIIVVGIGALLGKVSWGMAMIVGVGVALVFGAITIVNTLGAGSAANCQTGNVVGAGG